MEDLSKFIWQAKKSIYAINGDVYIADSMRHFSFRDGFYLFEDRKVGEQYYSGQEVIYEKSVPIWTMAYSGGIISSSVSAETIYAFLKESLLEEENPNVLRGPSFYQKENYFYLNEFAGEIGRFHGREYIRLDGQMVYELHYSGGYL